MGRDKYPEKIVYLWNPFVYLRMRGIILRRWLFLPGLQRKPRGSHCLEAWRKMWWLAVLGLSGSIAVPGQAMLQLRGNFHFGKDSGRAVGSSIKGPLQMAFGTILKTWHLKKKSQLCMKVQCCSTGKIVWWVSKSLKTTGLVKVSLHGTGKICNQFPTDYWALWW